MPLSNRLSRRFQHILDKNTIAPSGFVHQNVGDGADELAVLDDRTAAHEGLSLGTTVFIIPQRFSHSPNAVPF